MFKYRSNRSVVRIFLLSMMFITTVSTAIIGYSWIQHEYNSFEKDSIQMREDYIDSQKQRIKTETRRVLDYIEYTRSRIDSVLRNLLQERVLEAHTIATSIYNRYRGIKSDKEIKQAIKDTLRMIRFRQGRGYYYIFDMSGVVQLYPVKPEFEGQNQIDRQDNRGNYVVRNEIELVQNQGEGFIVSTTGKSPEHPDTMYPKVSFVKYFAPFDWSIGSREYRIDMVNQIQRDILERIGKIRFGADGYVFVFDFDGVVLMHGMQKELMGRNLWEMVDENGVKAVQEIRKAAEKIGGGYVRYSWYQPSLAKPSPKISFVDSIRDWHWMIGTGVYLGTIDLEIARRKATLESHVKKQVLYVIALFAIILVISLFITLFFSRRLRREFDVFTAFFKQSGDRIGDSPIDKSKLFSTEFKDLADHANQMLMERHKMEDSLRESQERLAVTFRSIAEGVIATDTEGRVMLINRAAELLTGWPPEEVIDKPVQDILDIHHEATGDPLANPVEKTLETGTLEDLGNQTVLVARNGSQRCIAGNSAAIRDKDSKIIGAVLVFQDVTDARKIEEDMQKNQKLESLGLLAGGIAHDFNNLLTGILGNISLAKAYTNPRDKIHKPLLMAEKASVRTRQLTQQLLTFAKGGEPIKKVLDISQLIKESVTFALRGSSVKAYFNFPDTLWPVEVDEGQMNQVFNNFIINAVQAMSGGGVIRVEAVNLNPEDCPGHALPNPGKRHIKISITDNGVGIPDDVLPIIFDPYFTTKPRGSGLGLASAHSIVSKHEGIIEVQSTVGEGSTFSVILPASNENEHPLHTEKEHGEEDLKKGSGRVLVMDDDKMVADVLKRQLMLLGYDVEVAFEGKEAIQRYRTAMHQQTPFDLVMMDLTIPGGLGGADAVKHIREIDPDVKAIVSSGYSTDPVMANFRKYGFNACIVKPYKLSDLSKTLQEALGKTQKP